MQPVARNAQRRWRRFRLPDTMRLANSVVRPALPVLLAMIVHGYAGAAAQPLGDGTCGTPATGWSTATVAGFQGTVNEVIREPDLMGAGTAAAAERLVVTLAFSNESEDFISLARGTTVVVLTCDGKVLSPSAGARIDPAALDMAPGAELKIQFTFILTPGTEPERIVVRRTDGDRCLGQLGFSLSIRESAAMTPTPRPTDAPAQSTPPTGAFATCDGGSATAGSSSSGSSGTGEAGTATGGRGCDGEDGVGIGAGATGGDGGDGGDAVSGPGGEEIIGADCTPEAGSIRTSWHAS